MTPSQISDIDQTLDMWNGQISSSFKYDGTPVKVLTACHPERDMIAATITSEKRLPIAIRFPIPQADTAMMHVTGLKMTSTPPR